MFSDIVSRLSSEKLSWKIHMVTNLTVRPKVFKLYAVQVQTKINLSVG